MRSRTKTTLLYERHLLTRAPHAESHQDDSALRETLAQISTGARAFEQQERAPAPWTRGEH